MKLTDEGARAPAKLKVAVKSVVVPSALRAALVKSPKARAIFEGFPPSKRREYADWVAEAKTVETRAKRVATSIQWLAQGKSRHWKYQ